MTSSSTNSTKKGKLLDLPLITSTKKKEKKKGGAPKKLETYSIHLRYHWEQKFQGK